MDIFFEAVESGDLEQVKAAIQKGANVNALGRLRKTPLHIAAENGHLEIVKELIKEGANVNPIDFSRSSPLHIAVEDGNLEIVKELLEHQANINAIDGTGRSPLHIALKHNHFEVALELINKNASVTLRDRTRNLPLHIAVKKGEHRIVKAILSKMEKDELDLVDKFNMSALHISVSHYNSEITKILLDNGANPNTFDINGRTPLHIAVENNDLLTVKELVKNGAAINALDDNNKTPLHYLKNGEEFNETKSKIVKIFLDAKVNFNARDNEGKTPLDNKTIREVVHRLTGENLQQAVSDTEPDTNLEPEQKQVIEGLSQVLESYYGIEPNSAKISPKDEAQQQLDGMTIASSPDRKRKILKTKNENTKKQARSRGHSSGDQPKKKRRVSPRISKRR